MELRKLRVEFVRNGFRYTQLRRNQYVAMYHQQLIKCRAHYWEIWIIRIKETRTIQDTIMPRMEIMPSPEEWGTFGWTFYTLEGAQFRYDELLAMERYKDLPWWEIEPPAKFDKITGKQISGPGIP